MHFHLQKSLNISYLVITTKFIHSIWFILNLPKSRYLPFHWFLYLMISRALLWKRDNRMARGKSLFSGMSMVTRSPGPWYTEQLCLILCCGCSGNTANYSLQIVIGDGYSWWWWGWKQAIQLLTVSCSQQNRLYFIWFNTQIPPRKVCA